MNVVHPPRPAQKIGLLSCMHADLCQLGPGRYISTFIDEATRYALIGVQCAKSDTAANVRRWVAWGETQTGQRVQLIVVASTWIVCCRGFIVKEVYRWSPLPATRQRQMVSLSDTI
jgi:hypothetical protein